MAKENENNNAANNNNEQPANNNNEQPKTTRKGLWGKVITGAIGIGLGVGGYFLGRKQGRKS